MSERQNKVGPHLVGLFGRSSAAVEGFPYSNAMKNKGLVWNSETLQAFISNPRAYVPGNRMSFAGVRDDAMLEALLAYLAEATKAD